MINLRRVLRGASSCRPSSWVAILSCVAMCAACVAWAQDPQATGAPNAGLPAPSWLTLLMGGAGVTGAFVSSRLFNILDRLVVLLDRALNLFVDIWTAYRTGTLTRPTLTVVVQAPTLHIEHNGSVEVDESSTPVGTSGTSRVTFSNPSNPAAPGSAS